MIQKVFSWKVTSDGVVFFYNPGTPMNLVVRFFLVT